MKESNKQNLSGG